MIKNPVRNLDHLVLPVPSLPVTRKRFSQLGFTVAPDARHRFGSENACIYFQNGTFIEPLAIGDEALVEANIRKGNIFLRRDMGYRFRNGDNGFSCVVFGDPDPKQERRQFKRAGYATGKIVVVRRPGVKVHVALAIDERSPDFTGFLCERPDGPPSFPTDLSNHANGATGIVSAALSEQSPADFQIYLATLSGQGECDLHSMGMDIKLPNASLHVLNNAGLKDKYGVDAPTERGLRAKAFDVSVSDLKSTQDVLNEAAVQTRTVGERLIVDPAPGQGAIIGFIQG